MPIFRWRADFGELYTTNLRNPGLASFSEGDAPAIF